MNEKQLFDRKIPPSLNIYPDACEIMQELEPEEAGRIIQAVIAYYQSGELPKDLNRVENMAFSVCKRGVDYSAETWRKRCEKNRENAARRWDKE